MVASTAGAVTRVVTGKFGPNERQLIAEPASGITMRPVKWRWEGRIAVGEITLFAGREGIGKSTVAWTS